MIVFLSILNSRPVAHVDANFDNISISFLTSSLCGLILQPSGNFNKYASSPEFVG